jgi:hypothetical protein
MGAMHALEFEPGPPCVAGPILRLHVIYTGPEATRASLEAAGLLAQDLDARVELLGPHVVPYPLPLHRPTTPVRLIEQSLLALVRDCAVDTKVTVLLCRDREETIRRWLPQESIAVIGRRRRWGAGSAWRLIRTVRRNGHHVIVVNTGGEQAGTAIEFKRRTS